MGRRVYYHGGRSARHLFGRLPGYLFSKVVTTEHVWSVLSVVYRNIFSSTSLCLSTRSTSQITIIIIIHSRCVYLSCVRSPYTLYRRSVEKRVFSNKCVGRVRFLICQHDSFSHLAVSRPFERRWPTRTRTTTMWKRQSPMRRW